MKAAADKYGVDLLTANTANQITKEIEVVNTYSGQGRRCHLHHHLERHRLCPRPESGP